MPIDQAIEIPKQVLEYLGLHHIITLGTSSFTGIPHAATTAYASDRTGLYFAMAPRELTLRNIEANHWTSFTIDDYTPDFRKVRELRGVGKCGVVTDADSRAIATSLFAAKLPNHPLELLANLHRITPLVLDFVDFEYTAGVAVPRESTVAYRAAPDAQATAASISTQLDRLLLEPGQVIVRQGERSERFFIIVDGEIEVRREGHGQDVTVTRHGPGEFFGEVGALTGAPQSATFVAVTSAVVLSIDRSSFEDVVSQSAQADLGQRVQATLADRRTAANARIPAGWYPDPRDHQRQRYWDGDRWTSHVSPTVPVGDAQS